MARSPLALDVPTLLLLLLQWSVFLGNFALWFSGSRLPLWAHVAIGVVPVHLAFTIWHEAAHGNVSNRRFLNHAVGVLGMLPYMTPYFMQRFVHLDHHKYLNEKQRDPNQIYADGPFWQLPVRYFRAIGYARGMLRADPRSPAMKRSDAFFLLLVASAWGLALWRGEAAALLWLWLVPAAIAKVIMDWYVNYLPHVGLPADRFQGTRIIDAAWLTPLVLDHNYHAIHHLWPGIPWHRYVETFRARLDYLALHRVPIATRLRGCLSATAGSLATPATTPADRASDTQR